MILKKNRLNRPSKLQGRSVSTSLLDLSDVELKQETAGRSVCIYGAIENAEKFRKKLLKCGQIEQVVEDRGGLIAVFSNRNDSLLAINKFHKKNSPNGLPLVVCEDLIPPILVAGHTPDLFVIRNVPDEISIPELWTTLNGDEIHVSHISFLPTSSRNVIIQCKVKEFHQTLLEKSGSKIKNWRMKVDLWFEFCFHMTRRNVVIVENVASGLSADSLKPLLGAPDGIEYLQLVDSHQCALVYCKSRDSVELMLSNAQTDLKISLYQKVAGLRYMAFLDNLHETTKDHDIMKFLGDCGNILKVTVSLDQRTGLKKAVAYFEEEESVKKAVSKSGSVLSGQTILVSPSLNKSSANTVYITNLHRGGTGLHLCLIFQDCGHIESVQIPRQKNIVNLRQAAIVVFRDAESVPKALEKSSKCKIRGMRIAVHQEDPYENRGKRGKSRQRNKNVCSKNEGKGSVRRKLEVNDKEHYDKKLKTTE